MLLPAHGCQVGAKACANTLGTQASGTKGDTNPLTRYPQHQGDLGKEQEVPQLEKVRDIIRNGTLSGWERGWEAMM